MLRELLAADVSSCRIGLPRYTSMTCQNYKDNDVNVNEVAEVHVNDLPAVALELVDYHPMEVLVVHGIVRAKGCGIIVVDDRLVRMRSVIGAEIGDERRDFQFRYAPVTVGSGRQVCYPSKPRANEFKQHALLCMIDINQHAYSF